MLKTILSLAFAAIVTFALFAFMAFLVTSDGIRLTEKKPATQISINPEKDDTKTRKTVRIKAIPPPVDSPPPAIALQPAIDSETTSINFELPTVNVGGIDSQLNNPQGAINRDGDATPIVRIEPRYPIKAARDGLEGYAVLSFTINEIGGIEDVKVLDSEPGRTFDKAARKALKRWKYRPKMVNGKAVKQLGQQIRLDFTLEKGR